MSDTALMILIALMGLAVGLMLGLSLGEREQQREPLPPLQTPPSILLQQKPMKAVSLPEFLSSSRN